MSAAEYSDDAQRIERDYVDPNSTTYDDVMGDLEEADFGNPDEIADWMLTTDKVGVTPDTAHTDGVTTREQVAEAVNDADEIGYSEERKKALTDRVSHDVGAPSESDLTRATIGMVNEQTTPSEQIEGDSRTSQLSLVRNQGGDVVGVIGGGGSAGRDVADELGADHYGSVQGFTKSLSAKPAPDGRKALLYDKDGDALGEVDL